MTKRFTVEQANRTLPLVRRIVEDIVRDYAEWQDGVRRLEIAAAARTESAPDPMEREQLERRTQGLAAEIESFMRELESLGVELKAFDTGLIDFPGEIAGRDVLLCWKLGEQSVQFWHEKDAGFAGRQPLDAMVVDFIPETSQP